MLINIIGGIQILRIAEGIGGPKGPQSYALILILSCKIFLAK